MTRTDPHSRFEELAAGHALHALEPEDEQEFLAHLEACAPCERAVVEHDTTLSHLAYAPEAVEPPAALLENIRAGVLASGRDVIWPQPDPGAATDASSLDAARERRARARLRRASAVTGLAAAAALVVSLGVWNVSLQTDRDQQVALGDRLSAAVREMGEADTDTVPLTDADGAVVAVALLHDGSMSLVVDGLAANDRTASTYVLWGESRFGDVWPVAAFDVTGQPLELKDGLSMQAGVAEVTTLMLTNEPGRVAPPLPTQPVLASGAV